jgi:UDP-N-acetylmuramyl pentapeptide phosphotransferase/UDP-N-acetylglucosamine-1-phosphate transferase
MTPSDVLIAAPLASIILSAVLVFALLRAPRLMLDRPNERSLHASPVPRTGGIAIASGALGAGAVFVPEARFLVTLAAALALISFVDDWRGLGALPRLAAHFIVAAIYVSHALAPAGPVEWSVLVLAVVWVANLYNFMDGSDGLAAGVAVIGFSAYAASAWLAGHYVLASLSLVVTAAAVPFLFVNFHPARMFMGDAGSVTLGFLAAALGALGWREGAWSPLFPVFVFSPFIADASLTLLRRILARQRFWEPHREHYYQKLIRMGASHRDTALLEYGTMFVAAAGGAAMAALGFAAQLALLAAWLATLFAFAFVIDRRWKRHLQQCPGP